MRRGRKNRKNTRLHPCKERLPGFHRLICSFGECFEQWRGARYPIDTSGFGIHVGFFLPYSSNAPRWDPNSEKRFGLETDFLTQFGLPLSDFEPLASNCTEVNVWHVRTDHHVSSDGLMRQLVNFNA
mmetsp:Transcript_31728/g.91936  ORF Transcript_31728/g.91936 Transcript_31728/m.91936 type:complete len:127 (+) Transcript_31728:751-1131(+)